MSVANAGINAAATSAAANDPHRGSITSFHGVDPEAPASMIGSEDPEEDRPTAPDQQDPKFETTKLETYAYYSYVPTPAYLRDSASER